MKNVYETDPYIREISTIVEIVQRTKKGISLSLRDNLFFPGGGGQSADNGEITLPDNKTVILERIQKRDGRAFLSVPGNIEIEEGMEIVALLEWPRRYRNMRYHTGAHVLMGAIRRHVSNYYPEGIEIKEDDFCEVHFGGDWDGNESSVREIIDAANSVIKDGRAVTESQFQTLDDAKRASGGIYRGPEQLSGPVRLITVKEWDANPCGGTHVSSSDQVGAIKLISYDHETLLFSLEGQQKEG